jgi:L-arabinonolactonase
MSARLLVDCRCTLGEGILWDARRGAWLWTDIEGRRLWQHRPADGITRHWKVPDRLGSFALCASGRVLLGLAKSLAFADLDAAAGDELAVVTIAPLEPALETRTNDGRTDRDGNFVFGTMSELPGHAPVGSFYQFSSRHGLRRLDLGAIGIPNSICFSPDGATIYFCDSPQRQIMQAAYDPDSARVSSIRVFADLRTLPGEPDGSIVDADGRLWNAVWGAHLIRRFTPPGGIDRELPVPAKNSTCVAFGGADLRTLAITSSRQEMSDGALATAPQSGGVFVVMDTDGAAGIPETVFADR